jgi:hypothetical protein
MEFVRLMYREGSSRRMGRTAGQRDAFGADERSLLKWLSIQQIHPIVGL